jgi:hypothetical protein
MDDVDAIPAKLVGGIERKAKTADIDVEAVPELPLSRVASVRRKPVMPRAERTTSRVARPRAGPFRSVCFWCAASMGFEIVEPNPRRGPPSIRQAMQGRPSCSQLA